MKRSSLAKTFEPTIWIRRTSQISSYAARPPDPVGGLGRAWRSGVEQTKTERRSTVAIDPELTSAGAVQNCVSNHRGKRPALTQQSELHYLSTPKRSPARRVTRPSKEMPESTTMDEEPALFPDRPRTIAITRAETAATVASKNE